jgi:hypothetical protein
LKFLSAFIGNRLNEWVMVACLFGLSLELLVWPLAMEASSFQYVIFAREAFPVALFYLLVSCGRITALVINGRSLVYGPQARALGALAGALIWGLMDLALFKLHFERANAIPSPGIPIYLALTLGELFTAYRAMTDVSRRSS